MRILFTLALIMLTTSSFAQIEIYEGDSAPDFEKNSADGSTLTLSKVDADLILLDFWAGWCKPCIKTIKSTLLPLHEKYDQEKLQIIGISYDKSVEKWMKSIEKYEVPWMHIYDADEYDLYKKYNIELIPTYFIVDRKGKVVGANILSSELVKIIDSYFEN